MDDLQTKYDAWQCLVQEYQEKFEEEDLSERGLETAIRQLLPKDVVDSRLKGRRGLKFQDLIDFTEDLLADHRDYRGRDGPLGGSLDEVRNGGDGGKGGRLANLGEMERLEELEKTLGQLTGG